MSESLSGRSVDEMRSAIREADRVAVQARYRKLELFAELDRRGLYGHGPDSLGLRALVDLVEVDLNCTRADARAITKQVERFAGRVSILGEALDPTLPIVGSALRGGVFSFVHATVIADVIEKLPAPVRAEHGHAVETKLVALAVEHDPSTLRTLAERITALLDPDGPEPKDECQYRQRGIRLLVNPDGTGTLRGNLTATNLTLWQTILGSLGAQRNTSLDEDGNTRTGHDQLGPDTRTPAQRGHDALEEAGRRLLAAGDLPAHAGLPAQLLITIDLRDLESRAGQATTHHGGTLTVQQALHLAAEATLIPVILDQELGLIEHGRGRRLASEIQRKVIFARDRGCTFPGCPQPAANSQVHHMLDWLLLGQTNPDNLTLTCGYHNNEAPAKAGKPN